MSSLSKVLYPCFFAGSLLSSGIAMAETSNFGGHEERYKGGGDKIPPQCQINVPSETSQPFWITWNCSDDNAGDQDIRTELWLFRKDSPASELIGNFLGFPAASFIDAKTLHSETIELGLPAKIRLVARDRSGNTAISPVLALGSSGSGLATCSLEVIRAATVSTGDVTGTPAQTLRADNIAVTVGDSTATAVSLSSSENIETSVCEVESLCSDDFGFKATLSRDDTALSGTVTLGNTEFTVSGTTGSTDTQVSDLSVTGTGSVSEGTTSIKLSCS